MAKKLATPPAPAPAPAAPVVSPFASKEARLRRQQEVHNQIVDLVGELLTDVAADRLQPAAFSQKAETFLRSLPETDRELALRSINGILGRLLSILPQVPSFFTGR